MGLAISARRGHSAHVPWIEDSFVTMSHHQSYGLPVCDVTALALANSFTRWIGPGLLEGR
jgi:hypothetical protein